MREQTCNECGHQHEVMASSYSSRDGIALYWCHENDHSCYEARRTA